MASPATERWARSVIHAIRTDRLRLRAGSPAQTVAAYRDEAGALLPTKIAAIELINLLRPIVAVARFITFSALALHEHPDLQPKLAGARDDEVEAFVQEVRRFYPFFPTVGGKVLKAFQWRDHRFARGDCVLLDL